MKKYLYKEYVKFSIHMNNSSKDEIKFATKIVWNNLVRLPK